MTLFRVSEGVLLTGTALEAALYAVQVAQRYRRLNGSPPSSALARLAEAMSPGGQADSPEEPVEQDEYMTTDEAAAVIGCSARQARRMAPALGGRLRGGRWLVDRRAVAEHVEGLNR